MAITNRAVKSFAQSVPKVIYLNGTPEDIQIMAMGQLYTVPAVGKVLKEHPKRLAGQPDFKDVFCSWRREGKLVPGTLETWSITKSGELGSTQVIWDAEVAVRLVLGITGDECTSVTAKKGLRVIAEDASDAEIEEARKDSRASWERWALGQAEDTVRWWMNYVDMCRRSGVSAPNTPPAVQEAQRLLQSTGVLTGPQSSAGIMAAEKAPEQISPEMVATLLKRVEELEASAKSPAKASK
jgi:hypothetical protein